MGTYLKRNVEYVPRFNKEKTPLLNGVDAKEVIIKKNRNRRGSNVTFADLLGDAPIIAFFKVRDKDVFYLIKTKNVFSLEKKIYNININNYERIDLYGWFSFEFDVAQAIRSRIMCELKEFVMPEKYSWYGVDHKVIDAIIRRFEYKIKWMFYLNRELDQNLKWFYRYVPAYIKQIIRARNKRINTLYNNLNVMTGYFEREADMFVFDKCLEDSLIYRDIVEKIKLEDYEKMTVKENKVLNSLKEVDLKATDIEDCLNTLKEELYAFMDSSSNREYLTKAYGHEKFFNFIDEGRL